MPAKVIIIAKYLRLLEVKSCIPQIDHKFTQQGLYYISSFLPNPNRQQNINIKVHNIKSSKVRLK